MLQKGKLALLVVLPSFMWGVALQGHAITIAEDGKALAVIGIAKDAPEPEQYAAAELAEFLRQVTGATFEVSHDAPPGKSRLLIGPHAALLADPGFTTEGLGAEGIVIRTVGNDLILAGGSPRGTLYAAYTFLEDHVGCRWWAPGVSSVPRKETLRIGPLQVRYVPPFEYRDLWNEQIERNGDWCVRHKVNGNFAGVGEKHGGRKQKYLYLYKRFAHTFYSVIPPDKYFDAHPEWFSEIDGRRTHHRAQLCLSNDEMRKEFVKNLRERLHNYSSDGNLSGLVWVAQNDLLGNCQCEYCTGIDAEEGSPSGLMVRFVNAVAAELEAEFPDIIFLTMAYQYTRKPPEHAKPRHNVMVVLGDYEASFSVPIADERNREIYEDFIGWSQICEDRLYIWHYVNNFTHWVLPHPNLRPLAQDLRLFVENDVKYVTLQGGNKELAELRSWVLAKLLWNPSLDIEHLIEEFVNGYYGPAGPHIKAYINLMHDAVFASGDWLGCEGRKALHTAEFLSFDVLYKAFRHLNAAAEAVKHDEELHFRVKVAQLPVMYTFMMRWEEFRKAAESKAVDWPMPDAIRDAFDLFKAIAEKKGITGVNDYPGGFWRLEKAVFGAPLSGREGMQY